MSSNPQNEDDDLKPILRHFDQEFGPRQEREPEPVYGEARPIPQPGYRLRVPLGRPLAVWALLALNVAIFVVPTLLQIIGVRVGGVPINTFILDFGEKENVRILSGQ